MKINITGGARWYALGALVISLLPVLILNKIWTDIYSSVITGGGIILMFQYNIATRVDIGGAVIIAAELNNQDVMKVDQHYKNWYAVGFVLVLVGATDKLFKLGFSSAIDFFRNCL